MENKRYEVITSSLNGYKCIHDLETDSVLNTYDSCDLLNELDERIKELEAKLVEKEQTVVKYLIAYVAPNDRVAAKEIFADNQPEARRLFIMQNPSCKIIAITVLEDEVKGVEYENK